MPGFDTPRSVNRKVGNVPHRTPAASPSISPLPSTQSLSFPYPAIDGSAEHPAGSEQTEKGLLLTAGRVKPPRPATASLSVLSRQQRDFLHEGKLRLQHEDETLSANPVAQLRAATAHLRVAPCADDLHRRYRTQNAAAKQLFAPRFFPLLLPLLLPGEFATCPACGTRRSSLPSRRGMPRVPVASFRLRSLFEPRHV